MAAADGRGPAGDLDRGAASAAAARAGGAGVVGGVGVVLLTKEPAQVKLSTLAALCTALECTPNELFEVDTTPVAQPIPPPTAVPEEPKTASARGRSLPPL